MTHKMKQLIIVFVLNENMPKVLGKLNKIASIILI